MSDKGKERRMKERGKRLSLCNCHWSELGLSKRLEKPVGPGLVKEGWGRGLGRVIGMI